MTTHADACTYSYSFWYNIFLIRSLLLLLPIKKIVSYCLSLGDFGEEHVSNSNNVLKKNLYLTFDIFILCFLGKQCKQAFFFL